MKIYKSFEDKLEGIKSLFRNDSKGIANMDLVNWFDELKAIIDQNERGSFVRYDRAVDELIKIKSGQDFVSYRDFWMKIILVKIEGKQLRRCDY